MATEKLQIVTKEQAVKLKELGFDWPTRDYYMGSGRMYVSHFCENHNRENITKEKYSAPTVALALKWLRDVKGLYIGIHCDYDGYFSSGEPGYFPEIDGIPVFVKDDCFDTHEQAESAGLDYALVLDFMKDSALEKLRKHAVIKSVCDQCRFENECRFKAGNIEQNCKFFIDKKTVL